MRATGSIFAAFITLAAIAPPAAAAPITINGITITDSGISSENLGINDVTGNPGFFSSQRYRYLVDLPVTLGRAFSHRGPAPPPRP